MNVPPSISADEALTRDEQVLLLKLARQALQEAVCQGRVVEVDLRPLPPRLQALGASFVTLTVAATGDLRGCIGTLEPYQPLALDVCQHAADAALNDYRFPPVRPDELDGLRIEISRLTRPRPLEYDCPEDLLARLRPGVDGVVLADGRHRATFLPQVWEKLPSPEHFLDHLCSKMGVRANLWKLRKLQVLTYQVEEFID